MQPYYQICTPLLISTLLIAVSVCSQPCRTVFSPIQQGLLCIRSPFVQTFPSISNVSGTSQTLCAQLCSNRQNCQAFSTADGPCQLFVFDRCSKSVVDCSCSRRGRVFVKQQPGLQAGRLCPPKYGKDLCGVKYRIFTPGGNWSQGRQKCASESGLVIMADVMDTTELNHLTSLLIGNSERSLWLNGFLQPVNISYLHGWFWIDCNLPVSSNLWKQGQPDNNGGEQDSVSLPGLDDQTQATNYEFLCECLDPFN